MYYTKELMRCHCGTNNRAPQWTFTDTCKPEVRPGAREESAAWLAAPAMNTRDATKVYTWRHYIGSVTATTHKEKGITLESNPSRGTLLPAPHGKGNKCYKNVKRPRHNESVFMETWHWALRDNACVYQYVLGKIVWQLPMHI